MAEAEDRQPGQRDCIDRKPPDPGDVGRCEERGFEVTEQAGKWRLVSGAAALPAC